MRVEEAVTQLKALGETGHPAGMYDIETLFKVEMFKRMELRSHGAQLVSKSLAEGVAREMEDWIVKICRKLGWSADACEKARQDCMTTAQNSMMLAVAVQKTKEGGATLKGNGA